MVIMILLVAMSIFMLLGAIAWTEVTRLQNQVKTLNWIVDGQVKTIETYLDRAQWWRKRAEKLLAESNDLAKQLTDLEDKVRAQDADLQAIRDSLPDWAGGTDWTDVAPSDDHRAE